jgi:transketolase
MSVELDALAVGALRFLSVDMVEAAESGHPGLPLGAAPMACVLFRRHLRFAPQQPDWAGRDRFVLSAGHGSALHYALLHVFGFGLPMEELKRFRQMGSLTPGHPEFSLTPGVECTTGPLGQGLGMAAGMALGQRWLAARTGVPHGRTFAIVSDGDLMEGVAHEAAAFAGHQKLGGLICLYDDNDISLDGPTSHAFTEDVSARFEAMGWQTIFVPDGNDLDAIDRALAEAAAEESKPSLIRIKTIIGYGSPKAGSSKAHGSPLGAEDARAAKEALGWPVEPAFHMPAELSQIAEDARARGEALMADWTAPAPLAADGDWRQAMNALGSEAMATRDAGRLALNAAAQNPLVIGGSADLVSSTKTVIDGSPICSPDDPAGRNIWFGVREHGMGAIVNGLALMGLRPFGSTFLVFSDYMRGSIRLSAIMQIPSVWIFTHDSVFVGEDGPTHEPIEQTPSLRLIPGLDVWRPADLQETAAAYEEAFGAQGPSAMVLTRQKTASLAGREVQVMEGARKGGYILHEPVEEPGLILAASGSEVGLALELAEELNARVVSLPCLERFRAQTAEYQEAVLPQDACTVFLEASAPHDWKGIALNRDAIVVGIDRFGESAPGAQVYEHVGFSAEKIKARIAERWG